MSSVGFVQREVDGLEAQLETFGPGPESKGANRQRWEATYAARQALHWALEPDHYASPSAQLQSRFGNGMAMPSDPSRAPEEPRPTADEYEQACVSRYNAKRAGWIDSKAAGIIARFRAALLDADEDRQRIDALVRFAEQADGCTIFAIREGRCELTLDMQDDSARTFEAWTLREAIDAARLRPEPIDLMVALKQSLAGQPVTGRPERPEGGRMRTNPPPVAAPPVVVPVDATTKIDNAIAKLEFIESGVRDMFAENQALRSRLTAVEQTRAAVRVELLDVNDRLAGEGWTTRCADALGRAIDLLDKPSDSEGR